MTIFNYSVNYFDVIIAGILLIFGIVGAKRGIFITLVNFIRYVVGFFLCIFCADRLPVPIYNTFVKEQLENYIKQKIVTSSNIDEIYSNFNNAVSSMPSFLKQDLNGLKIDFSSDKIVQSLMDEAFEPIVLGLIKVAVFIAVFVLFFGITGIIIHSIKKKKNNKSKNEKKKNPLSVANGLIGFVFGLFKGALVVFVLISITTYLIGVPSLADNSFINTASDSSLYQLLLDYNPFNVITEGIL